jgi:hypothetical protein
MIQKKLLCIRTLRISDHEQAYSKSSTCRLWGQKLDFLPCSTVDLVEKSYVNTLIDSIRDPQSNEERARCAFMKHNNNAREFGIGITRKNARNDPQKTYD